MPDQSYNDSLPGFRPVIEGIDSSGCVFSIYSEDANNATVMTSMHSERLPENAPVGRNGLNTTATA